MSYGLNFKEVAAGIQQQHLSCWGSSLKSPQSWRKQDPERSCRVALILSMCLSTDLKGVMVYHLLWETDLPTQNRVREWIGGFSSPGNEG